MVDMFFVGINQEARLFVKSLQVVLRVSLCAEFIYEF